MFTGALALLAINDHVLKARFPGFLTGKLSDFAGVFVVAVLAGLVTKRRALAFVLVAAGFGAIKLSPTAASVAAPLLGGATGQDASDLLALAALWPAHALLASEPRWIPQRTWLVPVAAIAAALTLTATSCGSVQVLDALAVSPGGVVHARIVEEPNWREVPLVLWAESADGGHTWMSAEPPKEPALVRTQVCEGDECYRIAGYSVERADSPGDWRTSFEFSDSQLGRMKARSTGCGAPTVELASIAALERSDGVHVVVAMGVQGVLHRSPIGGWERRAVLDLEPLPYGWPLWVRWLTLTPLLMALLGTILAGLVSGRSGGRPVGSILILSLGGGLLLMTLAGAMLLFQTDYAVAGLTIATLSALVFLSSLILARRISRAG
ncbi:MAG: hypothetical protein LC808_00660 [Actinobacteria bacterium]|nr:hypothetical protein [Actinomycetota bacterium]